MGTEWTLEAAEQICGRDGIGDGDVLDLLSSLVQKSLVIVDTEAIGGPRYRFLETVRQYARDRPASLRARSSAWLTCTTSRGIPSRPSWLSEGGRGEG